MRSSVFNSVYCIDFPPSAAKNKLLRWKPKAEKENKIIENNAKKQVITG